MAWGNNGDQTYAQNMVSDPEENNVLRVNTDPVGEGAGDGLIAVHALNLSTGDDARALKVEGISELSGRTTIDHDQAEPALEVTNTVGGGHAIKATGLSEFRSDNFGPAIKVLEDNGTGGVTIGEVDTGVDIRPRLRIEANTPANSGARIEALIYEPGTQFHAESTLHLNADPGTFDVILSHEDGGEAAFNEATVRVISPRLTVGNRVNPADIQPGQIDGNGTEGPIPVPLDLKIGTRDVTSDVYLGNTAHSVVVNAPVRFGGAHLAAAQIDGALDGAASRNIAIGTQNTSADVILARAGQDVIVQEDLGVRGVLTVGPNNNVGQIDGNNSHKLQLGTQNATTDVDISRSGRTTTVKSALVVDQALTATGNVTVGPSNNVGQVDANNSHTLKLGTQNATTSVEIGRNGQTATVNGALSVSQTSNLSGNVQMSSNAAILGSLTVGPLAAAGSIDAGANPGAANLQIGTGNHTSNVVVSRNGQTTDIMGQARLNGNGLVMNDAAAVTDALGLGFRYNANGHGNGASIDVYVFGVVVYYFDQDGGHNA